MKWHRLDTTKYCVVDKSKDKIIEGDGKSYFKEIEKAEEIKNDYKGDAEIWVLVVPDKL